MHSTTLRGVFPEPQPVHKRNFIRENVQQIKHLQGVLSAAGMTNHKAKPKSKRTEPRVTHRSVQTERIEDWPTLQNGSGDKPLNPSPAPKQQDDEKNFVQENIRNLKSSKPTGAKPVGVTPPPHKPGELPKYLKERKEEVQPEEDADCPPGHVLLPEEERKETLRVLRQSYADRIQELNGLPVRNDTLKMRRRKMEIEEELNKIDGGLKVFQRPKVFVKMNA